jgi:hypothetical protein
MLRRKEAEAAKMRRDFIANALSVPTLFLIHYTYSYRIAGCN